MVPTYDKLIFPLLKFLGSQSEPVSSRDAYDRLAALEGISAEDRAMMLPSGRQAVWANRVAWAQDRLKRAGLSRSATRGFWEITDKGRAVLKRSNTGLDAAALKAIADTGRSRQSSSGGTDDKGLMDTATSSAPDDTSPRERFEESFREMEDSLAKDLLDQVRTMDPFAFEDLVLDLLHAMGYGATRADLQAAARTGDGGIDGTVNLDPLGLQKVYVQAKRWKEGNTVGRPDIQGFYGALAERRASFGVFITASSFTHHAIQAAKSLSDTIVLIDGEHAVRLMIRHGVGVSEGEVFRVRRIDQDYFDS